MHQAGGTWTQLCKKVTERGVILHCATICACAPCLGSHCIAKAWVKKCSGLLSCKACIAWHPSRLQRISVAVSVLTCCTCLMRNYQRASMVGAQKLPQNSWSHIDASHSRQPLVKGERLVRSQVNAVIVHCSHSFMQPSLDILRCALPAACASQGLGLAFARFCVKLVNCLLVEARKLATSREILLWMTPSEETPHTEMMDLQWTARPYESELLDLRPTLAR